MNFLLHLDDCRHESCIGLRDAASLLEEISDCIVLRPNTVDAGLQDSCNTILKDLDRLQKDLTNIGGTLAEIRTMVRTPRIYYTRAFSPRPQRAQVSCQIKDQIDLQQISLTGVITVLAAIYLPFSFISVSNCLPKVEFNSNY